MTYITYTTYKSNKSKGGYQQLIVYWLTVEIYDLTVIFCKKYLSTNHRTSDQMIQAARSSKQNIVEASLEASVESNIKLTAVARASIAELLEDFKDYLRQNHLSFWEKDDPRNITIRQTKTNMTYESYKSYLPYTSTSESFANLMITLCYKTGYLLDKMLRSLQKKFIETGGFRENLFRKRIEYRNKKNQVK